MALLATVVASRVALGRALSSAVRGVSAVIAAAAGAAASLSLVIHGRVVVRVPE